MLVDNRPRKRTEKEEFEARKKWLSRYNIFKWRYNRTVEEMEQIQAAKSRTTSVLTGMPGRHGIDTYPEDSWAKAMDHMDLLAEYLHDTAEKLLMAAVEITAAISRLGAAEDACILALRYLYGMSIKEISEATGYSRSNVFNRIKSGAMAIDMELAELKPENLWYPSDYKYHYAPLDLDKIDMSHFDETKEGTIEALNRIRQRVYLYDDDWAEGLPMDIDILGKK